MHGPGVWTKRGLVGDVDTPAGSSVAEDGPALTSAYSCWSGGLFSLRSIQRDSETPTESDVFSFRTRLSLPDIFDFCEKSSCYGDK